MRKRDINGNTVSTNSAYLRGVIRNMTAGTYEMDSVGTMMVDTADGGYIVFSSQDEPYIYRHVMERLTRRRPEQRT
jgi:hypothetical protein